ncbi:Wadjet anti-phage system protein JetD domain-containing protein [Hydrogenophaga borbori]
MWPMRFGLGTLTESRVMKDVSAVMNWVQSWELAQREFPDGVQVQWEPRQWRLLGQQQVPLAVVVRDATALAEWVGHERRWKLACARRDVFEARFPLLRSAPPWSRHEEVATTWSVDDTSRLMDLLQWFDVNPRSMLYPRQLPVPGIDTKWLDSRRGLVRDFVLASRGLRGGGDFFEVCGLQSAPATLRMRVLCPELRHATGGLCDIEAPIEELARLQLSPRTLLVVENLATGLALPSISGAVAFMKLGHAISDLAQIPWLFADESGTGGPERALYWGDLDTHGFVILARARGLFPNLRSILMDEETLLSRKDQWVREASQSKVELLERLTPEEQQLYRRLREQIHGPNVRLEQERLSWPLCLQALQDAMN